MNLEMYSGELSNFTCPLCGRPLAGDEYQKAIEKLEKKVAETYNEQAKKTAQEADRRIKEIEAKHKKEIENLRLEFDRQQTMVREQLEKSYKRQLDMLDKHYKKLERDSQRKSLDQEKKLKAQYQKELQEKERQIKQLSKERERLRKLGYDEAMAEREAEIQKLKAEISTKEIQLKRFQSEVDDLKKQLTQSQSELKGEAGEIDLFSKLSEAFQHDLIIRQHRGTESGDLIHRIRVNGVTLDTPIVYDNKQAEIVTKKDIEKGQKYKEIHNTSYVFIVSTNLPKRDVPNGLFGEREGVFLIHPSVLIEVIRTVRAAIVEIHMQTQGAKNREAKEFKNTLEKLNRVYKTMAKLQDAEERAHGRLWKDRKELQSKIAQIYGEIASGIGSIIQDKEPMHELLEHKEEIQVVMHRNKKKKVFDSPQQ